MEGTWELNPVVLFWLPPERRRKCESPAAGSPARIVDPWFDLVAQYKEIGEARAIYVCLRMLKGT